MSSHDIPATKLFRDKTVFDEIGFTKTELLCELDVSEPEADSFESGGRDLLQSKLLCDSCLSKNTSLTIISNQYKEIKAEFQNVIETCQKKHRLMAAAIKYARITRYEHKLHHYFLSWRIATLKRLAEKSKVSKSSRANFATLTLSNLSNLRENILDPGINRHRYPSDDYDSIIPPSLGIDKGDDVDRKYDQNVAMTQPHLSTRHEKPHGFSRPFNMSIKHSNDHVILQMQTRISALETHIAS